MSFFVRDGHLSDFVMYTLKTVQPVDKNDAVEWLGIVGYWECFHSLTK